MIEKTSGLVHGGAVLNLRLKRYDKLKITPFSVLAVHVKHGAFKRRMLVYSNTVPIKVIVSRD